MARHKQRRYAETKPSVKMNGGYSRRQREDILTAQGEVNYPAAKDCVASGPDGPSLFLLRRNAAS